MNPWINSAGIYSVYGIILGNNPLSKLEIVSSLNSFNLTRWQYLFNNPESSKKYNLKVYLGTIQTASTQWIFDWQTGQKNDLPRLPDSSQKSGSWLTFITIVYN